MRNAKQEIKILTSFNISKGIRDAIKHISACPTKQATADGEAVEKAKMARDSAWSSAVSSPSCDVHVRSAPWMQGIPEHTHQGFKK